MAHAIPELLQRLSGDDAAEQRQAARQLGDLAGTLARESPSGHERAIAAQTFTALVRNLDIQQAAGETGEAAAPAGSEPKHDWETSGRGLCRGLLANVFQIADDEGEGEAMVEGLACIKGLLEDGVPLADLLDTLVSAAFDEAYISKREDTGLLAKMMRDAAELGILQGPEVVEGMRRVLCDLDDISVDVPKEPKGQVLGGLLAGGGADLAAIAEHVRTADAQPDEIQEGVDTMLVGGSGAAKTIGSLLQQLAAEKGEEATSEVWGATGLHLATFLPAGDREDEEELNKLKEQFGLQFLPEPTALVPAP